ncbi:hypothetical protein B0H14DRAFT_752482 [Mycena olivaceomarginata]|nr:hypothetical protein B0H14DRAFT_752482 [Mycena olivaceomarginata]
MNEADFEDEDDWDVDNESNYTQTSVDGDSEASEQDDCDVDDETSYPQTAVDSDAEAYSEEDDNNSGSTDCSSRRVPMNSNSVNHDHHALTAFSGTFKFLMNAHLALILFLGLSWLYEQMIQDGQCGTTRHFDQIGAVRYGISWQSSARGKRHSSNT